MKDMESLLAEIRDCRLCSRHLPLGPRPIIRAAVTAKLLIIGQAPGTRVHESGVPWNDKSGERLRDWLQVSEDVFYDQTRIAIMPTASIRVEYRDTWYYIDETDQRTKRSFRLLEMLWGVAP